MAGHITTHRASHAIFARRFSCRQLVEASVELTGRTFRTLIPEGASAEDLIEKVARENGGGVAKVYYPEFKTWEIVAVKIGDQVLVKDSPERVAEADFSQFPDPGFRSMAIRAAANSEGGIHFSIGRNGIPLAIMDNEEIVFPNAEELRIGKNTRSISLWMTSANVNPVSLADLSQSYSSTGGLQVSRDALRKIEESHGGCRSDKLLLEDNILVLNKDTGELSTLSQPAAAPRNLPIPSPEFPPAVSLRSDILAADQQIRNLDGNQSRNPCLLVRTFDGLAADQFRIRMEPAMGPAKAQEEPARAPILRPLASQPRLAFSILLFEKQPDPRPPDGSPPSAPGPSASRTKAAPPIPGTGNPGTLPENKKAALRPEMILKKFSEPRRAKIPPLMPSSVSATLREARTGEAVPSSPARKRRRRRRPEIPKALHPAPMRIERRKRPRDGATPPKRPSALKPGARRNPPKPRGRARYPAGAPAELTDKRVPKPKAAKRPDAVKTPRRRSGQTVVGIIGSPKRGRSPRKKPVFQASRIPQERKSPGRLLGRAAKKRAHPYFMREMLGLLPHWKKRGRKLRTKKKSAV